MARTDVLICGAGPTGLMLALRLARAGVRLRIVDPAAEPGTTSRALVVHARTLEFYRQMGIAEAFLRESLPFTSANFWVRGRHMARAVIGDMGKGISPFPFMVVCPQDRHERFLIAQLERAGLRVERGVEVAAFEQSEDGVTARLTHADGREEAQEASFLAGCDGAHSRVREVLGVGFPGGTYNRVFYVADVEATGPVMNNELHVALDDADFMAVFPLLGGRTARFVGSIEAASEDERTALRWKDVSDAAVKRLGVTVERVNWFSTYRVHHRVAGHFRKGRAFLLGDAGHIHSPVGGQGMNTGLGDAVNLAWKIASVVHGRSGMALLETYEPERVAFANRLVNTTDRAFVVVSSDTPLARFTRIRLTPVFVPFLLRFAAWRRFAFRTVSQTAISYRGSRLSAGQVGAVSGGDRLPWVELPAGTPFPDNFAPLDGLAWQAHVYGRPARGLVDECRELGLPLHEFAWDAAMARAGLTRDALYLIRPDGHVGLADAAGDPGVVARYLAMRGITTQRSS